MEQFGVDIWYEHEPFKQLELGPRRWMKLSDVTSRQVLCLQQRVKSTQLSLGLPVSRMNFSEFRGAQFDWMTDNFPTLLDEAGDWVVRMPMPRVARI